MVRLTGQRPRATWGRVTLACAAMLLLAALASAPASAARAGLVRSFGDDGIAPLEPPLPPGANEFSGVQSAPAPDGSTYVVAEREPCNGSCRPGLLFHFRRDGRLDRSFGDDGHVAVDGGGGYSLALDSHGRPLLSRAERGTYLLRYTTRGHLDRSFGGDGEVYLPRMIEGPGTVQPLPGGGLLVSTEDLEQGGGFAPIRLEELHENGVPVRTFGSDGFVNVGAPGTFHLPPAISPTGAIMIAATGCCTESVSLIRVSARGRLDTRFDRAARRSLARLATLEDEHFEAELEADDVVARPDGGVDLFGDFGQHGFDARIEGNGGAAAGFGRHGVRLFERPVERALPLRGGGFLVFGNGWSGPLRAFVIEPGGSPDPRFRPVALSPYSEQIDGVAIAPGVIDLAFERRHVEKLPRAPYLARLRLPRGLVAR